mmetsp:Transcript_8103/g.18956  ORF Transcript_8103/g.18956 Transcript_8103/m.18956 type:complete len:89 (+) Transcript_8103:79-345(+)
MDHDAAGIQLREKKKKQVQYIQDNGRVQSEIVRQSQIFVLVIAVLLLASVGLHVLRYHIKEIVAPHVARKAKRHFKGPVKTDGVKLEL